MFNPQLATFVCVADCGSFSQAAEKLYLSSTAVMKQLNALERHLELKLLERTRRGTVLTPAGEVIYRYARQMFADSDRALREARAAAQAARSAFCVGTSILNPCRPFMDLWYRFCGHFPGYQLHLVPYEDDHQGILGEIGALGEKFSVPATPVSGWTAAIFSLWGSIATASPSPGDTPWRDGRGSPWQSCMGRH